MENLWAQLLQARGVVAHDELQALAAELSSRRRLGAPIGLGQLLLERGRLSTAQHAQIHQELLQTARTCRACGSTWLSRGDPDRCPGCGREASYSGSGVWSGAGPILPEGRSRPGSSPGGHGPPVAIPPGGARPTAAGSSPHPEAAERPSGIQRSGSGSDGSDSAPTPEFKLAGRRVGGYEIVAELGRGAMGVVLTVRAQDGRQLAMKVILSMGGTRRKRFAREIALAQKLQHPNLVPVEDWGEEDGRPWFVMPLVEGRELGEVLKSGDLSQNQSARLLAKVARAVHYAHEQQVIHRDLKPSNIRVGPDRTPYVLDFGLAKDLEADDSLSRTGTALGTPNFWAPEQARGLHREVDARTDVYALGAILYEMLTGRVVFPSNSGQELLAKIFNAEPRPPSEIKPGVHPRLEAIALRCLRKAKADRYSTARAVARELEDFVGIGLGSKGARREGKPLVWVGAAVALTAALAVAGLSGGDVPPSPAVQPSVASRSPAPAVEVPRARLAKAYGAAATAGGGAFQGTLRQTEKALTEALQAGPDRSTQAELLLHRGRIRRLQCLWAEALEDQRAAMNWPATRCAASLEASVILMRWRYDAAAADQALSQAIEAPAGAEVPGSDGLRQLALGYSLLRDGTPQEAGDRIVATIAAHRRDPWVTLAAFEGLALVARAITENRETWEAWFTEAETVATPPRYAYLFLVDRAYAHAKTGQPERAQVDLDFARVLWPEGIDPELVQAYVHAGREELQSLREASQRALTIAEARPELDADSLARTLRALADETRSRAVINPEQGISYEEIVDLSETVSLDVVLSPHHQVWHAVIDVPPESKALWVGTRGADLDLGLAIRRDTLPRSPQAADLIASSGALDETLVLWQGSLRPGIHHITVYRPTASRAPIALTVRLLATGELPPRPTRLEDEAFQLDPRLVKQVQRAEAIWAIRSEADGLRAFEDLSALAGPSIDEIRFLHAQLLTRAGRWNEAGGLLASLESELPPLNLRAPFLRARCALEQGAVGPALALASKLAQVAPEVLDLHLLRFEAALAAKDSEAARSCLEQLGGLAPEDALTVVLAARLLSLEGKSAEAQAQLKELLGSADAPLSAIRRGVETLLAWGEVDEAEAAVEAHASRWLRWPEAFAFERWAIRQARGAEAASPPIVIPDERLRLQRLQAALRR